MLHAPCAAGTINGCSKTPHMSCFTIHASRFALWPKSPKLDQPLVHPRRLLLTAWKRKSSSLSATFVTSLTSEVDRSCHF
ncbi:hypothetical protein M3J09_003647 [Ascochyta lentis]